jgi:hypothetical protein
MGSVLSNRGNVRVLPYYRRLPYGMSESPNAPEYEEAGGDREDYLIKEET